QAQVQSVEAEDSDEKKITIVGIRASMARAQSEKKNSTSIVESISAEDIGKLPDSSIAESIARLPGLAAQRLDGRASRVTIRGFGENESATTFNGREQVSISDNRGVEFDLYPSEIMSGVTVYKTPDATIDAEGIAGVIDLQTIKPLSKGEDRILQVNGLYEKTSFGKLNPDGDDAGFSGTIFYMDKFADDTVGLAIAYSTKNSPNQEKRWNAWGYTDIGCESYDINGNCIPFQDALGNDVDPTSQVLGGAKPFVRSSTLERDSFMAVLEIAASDDLTLTFDALTVDFKDEKRLRGIEVPFKWGQGSVSPITVDDATGFVTQGLTQGQRVVVRNDYETRKADLKSFGFNALWTPNDIWTLDFDASHSKVERDIYSLESYSGTGRGNDTGIADDIGYTFNSGNAGATFTHGLNYADYNLIQLGGPLTWGWSSALNNHYGITGTPLENHAQDGFLNTPTIDDELTALKFAAKQDVDGDTISSVTYGIAYKEREKNKLSDGYFMTLNGFPTNPGTLVVPEQYRLGTVSLDFIGMGNMIAYDPMALIRDGYYSFLSEKITGSQHLTKSWNVKEEVTSFFVSADIDTEVSDFSLTGNVGVRYVKTTQSSNGHAGNSGADGRVVSTPTYEEYSYNHVLPNINLKLAIDDEQSIRFGYAKTISRPKMDEMNASIGVSFNQQVDNNGNYWSVWGGNPRLDPKEATGIDLTYENYFSETGYISLAYFTKNIDNWNFGDSYQVDMSGINDPNTNQLPVDPVSGEILTNAQGTAWGQVSAGDSGSISGVELTVNLPFEIFSESLDGFGINASFTNLNPDMHDNNGNKYEIPGMSKEIENLTIYFERSGFQARASMRKREDFKGYVYGIGFDTQQVDIVGETIWDAQIGYDFGEAGIDGLEGLSIYLQGLNLTKEPFTTLSGDNALQVRDYQEYGSTYLLGASYKF
ncbi:MAG: TonB-dependent receptor, partial [Gammaproteobacteria bacterium]|nr:TonB-dependent receptor [Gammaproteobacteria bacterium]